MKCMNCGAELLSNDQFCSKCGAKAVREQRCPDCGTVLREGTKFCHKCGRQIESRQTQTAVSEDTLGIPMDLIEKKILSETAAEMSSAGERLRDRKREEQSRRSRQPEPIGQERGRKTEKTVRRLPKEQMYEDYEEDYEEEEEYYEEDYDYEDYEDEEREGIDPITVMTAVVGCVILVIAVILGYHFYREYAPRDYEKEEQQITQEDEEETQAQEPAEEEKTYGQIRVKSNVNVRDNPDTQNSNVLKVAKEGETYSCTGEAGDGNWYEIILEDGTSGYVYKDYVEEE